MDRPIIVQRFMPVRVSTTSDSQIGAGSCTSEMYNLSAIMRNNVVLFESPLTSSAGITANGTEEDVRFSEY